MRDDIRQAASGGRDFTPSDWPTGWPTVVGYCRSCGSSDGWVHAPDCSVVADTCDHDYYTKGCQPCGWRRSEMGQ